MKRLALLACVLFAGSVHSQPPTGAENREALKKLAYLVGNWEGEAEIATGPGPKIKVKQSETIEYKLNGAILTIEGVGRGKLPGKDEDGVVFNAYAVISYDTKTKKFLMRAYRMEGMQVDADFELTDKGFIWGFKEPQRGMKIRYTFTHEPAGTWKEVGEYSQDEKAWTKFIEMNLKKKS